MNLHHLRYFVTLARLEHYTKAAKQLSITQPSLSHAIAALEEELNVRLFEKDGRNVVLTRWGKVFLKDVEEILAHLDSSVANLKMTGTGNGTIDIGCIRVLGASYVPALMREFIKANPDKNISYRLHSEGGLTAEIIEGLKNRQFDIAFCSKYKDDPSIDFVKVASQDLVMAVPLDHPLTAQDTVKLKAQKKNWLSEFIQFVTPMPSAKTLGVDSSFTHEFRIDVTPDDIYKAETEILKELAREGSCFAAAPFRIFVTDLPKTVVLLFTGTKKGG